MRGAANGAAGTERRSRSGGKAAPGTKKKRKQRRRRCEERAISLWAAAPHGWASRAGAPHQTVASALHHLRPAVAAVPLRRRKSSPERHCEAEIPQLEPPGARAASAGAGGGHCRRVCSPTHEDVFRLHCGEVGAGGVKESASVSSAALPHMLQRRRSEKKGAGEKGKRAISSRRAVQVRHPPRVGVRQRRRHVPRHPERHPLHPARGGPPVGERRRERRIAELSLNVHVVVFEPRAAGLGCGVGVRTSGGDSLRVGRRVGAEELRLRRWVG